MTRKYHFQDERYVELNPFFKLLIFLAFDKVGSYDGLAKELNYRDSSTVKRAMTGDIKNFNRDKLEKAITLIL